EGLYNDLLLHRVIQNFMIQGGDPDSKGAPASKRLGTGGPGYTVPAEFNPAFCHKKGALSAARMGDNVNPEKASSGSQFYIVQGKKTAKMQCEMMGKSKGITYTEEQLSAYETIGGTPHLDQGYTVFGEVVEGLEVIDKIAAVKKGAGDRPVEDVKMKISLIKK
ncbi:MAG: peptidylprolyl isomerase, partial [Proteobacteria bacterium]|nr:peptidylprolyl isomerase [Pseudomonadota bacterium]